jgi:outer membrane lipoprotein-sorting protein
MRFTRRIATALILVASICSIASAARAAEAFTPNALMQTLAKHKASRTEFVEKKYLSTLDRPLESSGELTYTAPARLERRTIKPKPETLIVDGDTLTIERNGTRRSISLASYPEVAAFTDSIRATLAGDLDALTRSYRVVLDGTSSQWRLTLLPSDARIAAVVSRVTVNGHDDRIESFEVLQADGNRSVTTIAPAANARP